jgi:hypothetical protein
MERTVVRYVSCYGAATKFIWLIALMSKTKEEVALALLTIFSVIAPPRILQSDQGGEFKRLVGSEPAEFLGGVITTLKDFLPGCIEIHGRSYHSASQGVHGLCGSHSGRRCDIGMALVFHHRFRGEKQPKRRGHPADAEAAAA